MRYFTENEPSGSTGGQEVTDVNRLHPVGNREISWTIETDKPALSHVASIAKNIKKLLCSVPQ